MKEDIITLETELAKLIQAIQNKHNILVNSIHVDHVHSYGNVAPRDTTIKVLVSVC